MPINARYLTATWRVTVMLLLATIAWQLTVANHYLRIVADKEGPDLSAIEAGLDQIHGDIEDLGSLMEDRK